MTGFNDTIAAICSGLTSSGINVIRISGDDAFEVADKVFLGAVGKKVSDMKQFSVNYGHIVERNTIIDEVLLLKMQAPHSYTRENVIEIDCHGGIIVTRKILDIILNNGARLAEPGEFTKRAFLNGRIDLSQAEAVADIINSKSELALKNSMKQLGGNVRKGVEDLCEKILSKTAYIEAALDDPEHISLDGFSDTLLSDVTEINKKIDKLIKSSDDGRLINEGINTCILGLPNAGKSSLLNAILDEDRAIVTNIPGTTRDTLRESVNLGDVLLNIIDTAGIRDTDNIIEQMGVDRAKKEASSADLVLYCIDAVKGVEPDDETLLTQFADKKMIILINKTDIVDDEAKVDALIDSLSKILGNAICKKQNQYFNKNDLSDDKLRKNILNYEILDNNVFIQNRVNDNSFINNFDNVDSQNNKIENISVLKISALTGFGIDELKDKIKELFYTESIYSENDILITNARHKELLMKAKKSIDNVIESIDLGMSEDFLTIDLMDAYTSLKGITGEAIEDDLADKIFKEFCMGK